MRKNIYHTSTQVMENSKTSCIAEKFQIPFQTRQTLFSNCFKVALVILKVNHQCRNESIDMEQLVSAHVIPVKMDVEKEIINSSLRTPPLSPIPHFSQQNV